MPAEFPCDVFHSHHHADKPRLRRLAERLKAAGVPMEPGLRLWWDEWVIPKSDLHLSSFRIRLLHTGRRFIPLLLGDWDLADTLRRCKVVAFCGESEVALAEVLATVCLWFVGKKEHAAKSRVCPSQTIFLHQQERQCKPTCAVPFLNN